MRKLVWITVGFVYLLMVWGNLVSSTGSGLACPDWPLCHGTIAPGWRPDIILEWGHRCLAFVSSVLILSTVVLTLRAPGGDSNLKRSGRSLILLLGLQVLLGGTTVLLGLSMAVSTVHLIVATLVFSGLITVASVKTWGDQMVVPSSNKGSNKVKRLAVSGLAGLIIQLALGALVRHGHAGLACPLFPNCVDSFWPIPLQFETIVAFTHRWWGIFLLGLFVHLAVESARSTPALARAGRMILGIAIAQVILGIGTVLSALHTHTRATHAAVGYALWGSLFYLAIRSGAFPWIWKKKEPRGASESLPDGELSPA